MLTIPEEIKELLHQDHWYKNIRIHFPNGERSDICNDLIVKDSVKLTESLCSRNELKFGLCESPVFECEVVGVGNIKGATIEVYCEIGCTPSVSGAEWRDDLQRYVYPIPYGVFVVQDAVRQADMIHRKITAYNLLATSEFRMTEFQVIRANTPVSQEIPFVQSIVGLISENVQDNAFGCSEVELAMSELSSGRYDIPNYLYSVNYIAYKYKVLRILPNNSDKLYRVVVDDPNYDKNRIRYGLALQGNLSKYGGFLIFQCDRYHSAPVPGQYKNCFSGLEYYYPYMSMPASDANTYYHVSSQPPYETGWYIAVPYESKYVRAYIPGEPETVVTTSLCDPDDIHLYEMQITDNTTFYYNRVKTEDGAQYVVENPSELSLRSLYEGYVETKGKFCGLDRFNNFFEIDIKQQFGLTPQNTLYPDSDLYPEGVTGGKLLPQDYQSCWYNDDYTKPFGCVTCTYKDLDNLESVYIKYFGGFDESSDINSYRTYYLTNNYLIDNSLWTEQQIEAICTRIANSIEGVRYMPVEFVGRGLPYVEAGDTFEILTKSNDSITTIVLNRTLTGELTLTDNYKSV